jgi:hypothetical protein
MADEITIPILPCTSLDDSVPFYEALGFVCTYRQNRPNPYAVVSRDDIHIHLFALEGFDPEQSYGSVIIAVPDPDMLYEDFAEGLRVSYGKLPSAGIPRILRPRQKQGTVRSFSIVDPGGNWLRISKLGDTEEESEADRTTGLARVIDNAARQGDARGDDAFAIKLLDNGLAKYTDAPGSERVQALLYRAELAVRLGDLPGATASLAEARAVALTDEEALAVADDIALTNEVVQGVGQSDA